MAGNPPRQIALTVGDYAMFKAIGVSPATLALARVRRVTHDEALEICGIQYRSEHLEGVAFPYVDPKDDRIVGWRVRRDNPEVDSDGKPIGKYLASPDRRHLYLLPDSFSAFSDTTVPAIFVESEKAVLAIRDAAGRANRRHSLLAATGGCWGFLGVVGKRTNPRGVRVDEKGVLPDFDKVTWTGRDTIIILDSNVATNPKVQAARRRLTAELEQRGAMVRYVDIPIEPGINGPDDFIGKHGGGPFWALVDGAKSATATKSAKTKPEKPKQGREVQFDEPDPWPDPVDGDALITAIAATFSRYLALPKHASTALALWVLHAYTFDAWFASPFLAITSPEKRCGKTLLLILLGALVPRRMFAANVTPAVLFRAIEKFNPTLLIDEADTFVRDNDELRGVLNSGHTRTTATVIRAVGDDHDPGGI